MSIQLNGWILPVDGVASFKDLRAACVAGFFLVKIKRPCGVVKVKTNPSPAYHFTVNSNKMKIFGQQNGVTKLT